VPSGYVYTTLNGRDEKEIPDWPVSKIGFIRVRVSGTDRLLVQRGLCYEANRSNTDSNKLSGGAPMITVIAKLPVKEGKMDEAMAAFKVLMSKVASEEGTVLYSLNQEKANPNTLVVVEQYQDKAALEFRFLHTALQGIFTASVAFIGGKPEMMVMKEIQRV